MNLEDFPIFTEMKGGISSIAGVEELVSVMQKQKDCVSINVDIFKQWSTLLSIISSIDKKACLDHFVQLDGLNYLHEWLMQAQKCTDCAVEEFVNSLLTTIEGLPVNVEKFISCGIMITVEQLRCHKSITVKNKSQVLLDRWSNAVIGGTGFQGLGVGVEENFHPIHIADSNVIEKDLSSTQAIAKSLQKESSERAAEEVSVGTESHHSNLTRCSDNTHVENNTKFIKSNLALTASSSNSTCVDEVRDCNSSGSSLVLDSCQEKFFTVSCLAVESDHERTYGFHTAFQWDDNMLDSAAGDVQVGYLEIEKETSKMEGYKCTPLQKETFDLSSSYTLSTSMPLEEGLDHAPQNLVDREGELSGLKNVEYQEKGPQCRMSKFFKTSDKSSRAGDSQEIAVDVNIKTSLHAESLNPVDSHLLGSKLNRIVKKSVFGLEYEEMDALEVARQVAIDVELEVVGYKEHFSNSPDDFCGEATGAQSPDLADGIKYKPGIDVGKFLPSEHSSKYVFSRSNLQLSDGIIDDQMTHKQVSESPSMKPAAKEQDLNVENSQYRFDLNEDIYKGEIECSASPISTSTAKFSTPIVVFASKGVPRLPVLSIQFGAESGWRGYSATSAFQPVSPRKTPKIVKVPDQKQKLKFLEIDLNVNETQYDGIVDTALLRQIPVSSSHPTRESAVEVSSRNVEKLKLDLNRIGDEDETVKFSLNYGLQLHDVDHSLSTASSSCSKQHYTRDFNLNDNPTILVDGDASSFHGKTTSKHFPTRGSSKIDDDSAIKTTGLRMPVDRKLCKGQAQQEPFLNNSIVDSIRPAKPMMHYPQISPAYGCNILQAGAAIPLPPTFLCKPGSMPYMVDSRGTALIPQVMELTGMSSIPAVNRQLPVVMDVPGAPMGLSGFFPTVTRLAPCETGRRNVDANFNHLLIHNGKPEEKLRTSFQLSSLGMVLKRKEPDSSLEGRYPLGFRQMPFWK